MNCGMHVQLFSVQCTVAKLTNKHFCNRKIKWFHLVDKIKWIESRTWQKTAANPLEKQSEHERTCYVLFGHGACYFTKRLFFLILNSFFHTSLSHQASVCVWVSLCMHFRERIVCVVRIKMFVKIRFQWLQSQLSRFDRIYVHFSLAVQLFFIRD